MLHCQNGLTELSIVCFINNLWVIIEWPIPTQVISTSSRQLGQIDFLNRQIVFFISFNLLCNTDVHFFFQLAMKWSLSDWQQTCSILWCFVSLLLPRILQYSSTQEKDTPTPLRWSLCLEYKIFSTKGFLEYISWIACRKLLKSEYTIWMESDDY